MMESGKVLLVGDSVLENSAYVGTEGRSSWQYLRDALSPGFVVDSRAQDGAKIHDVRMQIRSVRALNIYDAIIVSAGGNDLLEWFPHLAEPTNSLASALVALDSLRGEFHNRLASLCDSLLEYLENGLNSAVYICTVYSAHFENADMSRVAGAATRYFNPVIRELATRYGFSLVELDDIFTEDEDFTLEIEPSDQGSRKLADAVARIVLEGHGNI